MSRILFFNKLRWYARLPLKWLVFAVATVAVCYPYPSLLAKHLRHWRDPNALIDPNAESLQPLALDLRTSLPPGLSAKKTLQHVEKFVYQRVPYEWDWNTWGMADYLPTVDEVLEKGKEDCDGRAVVAASLLAGLGFKSEIVTDFAHVWVKTDKGETMGPGRRQAVVATDRGLEVHWRGLIELPRAFAYGLAVFPGEREYALLVLGWFLLLGTQTGLAQSIIGLRILLTGFSALRFGGADYRNPALSLQWLGVSLLVAGILVLFLRTQRQSTLSETVAPVP